jgi:hypothetical protein
MTWASVSALLHRKRLAHVNRCVPGSQSSHNGILFWLTRCACIVVELFCAGSGLMLLAVQVIKQVMNADFSYGGSSGVVCRANDAT